MKQPSTEWREQVAPDEAAHLVRVAKVIGDLQRARSKKFGQGRALHRKQLLAATGTLEVFAGLPDHARYGLFATPGRHRALVRLSNGGPDVQGDRVPDIFIDFLEAATAGPLPGILHLFTAHGLGGGLSRLRDLFGMLNKKFNGFAAERFNTVAPICCGPYAVRVRLAPAGNPPPAARSKDIVADMRERLAIGDLTWNLELQFFVDEATTPIEDTSVSWPDSETPIVVAARLTLPRQGVDAAAAEAEAARFDAWTGLAAHRPLGEVMRARKVAYFESQKGRNAV